MSFRTLEDKIKTIGNPVEMLRNASAGPYQFPIKAEFTNWRDEQKTWRSGAVLFDQSFHMTDHYIEDYNLIRDEILRVGEPMGLRAAGSKAYSTVAHESGWFPSPLPAVYSGEKMKPFREWLGADSFISNLSLGGSLVSDNVEDYYLTPYDIGYGHIVKFDHDFIGREALEAKKNQPHKHKRTLRWSNDDVVRVFASIFNEGDRFKFMDIPASHYATCPYDLVSNDSKAVGLSHYPVYTSNVGGWISLALLDEGVAEPGTDVSLTWGEPDGGTKKPTVERHVQTEIACTVELCPILRSGKREPVAKT